MRIIDLRSVRDISALAKHLDNDEARRGGIYITERELRYYISAPWISAAVLVEGQELKAFASVNLSEMIYGRGVLNEFYVPAGSRKTMLSVYRFYKWVMDNMFSDCHRVVAYCKSDNLRILDILVRLGWKRECAVKRFDRAGTTYWQLSKGV